MRVAGQMAAQLRAALDHNPSYVFFREVPAPAPGTLAARIDAEFVALGARVLGTHGLDETLARLRDAAAKLHRVPQPLEHHFNRRHCHDDIEAVHIAHVGKPENLPLHMVLSPGRGHAVLDTQVLVDRLSIHTFRR